MDTRILETDTPKQAATKIYKHFKLLQNCTVRGLWLNDDNKVVPKGLLVWQLIKEMDYADNYICEKGRAPRRKVKQAPSGTVGDASLATKIFKHKVHTMDGVPAITIWRLQ